MKTYTTPLSLFFVWHPLDKDVVQPVFDECFESLRRNVDRPFSRSVNVPFFIRTSDEGEVPPSIVPRSQRTIIFAFIGQNCVSDDSWVEYIESLGKIEGVNLVPVALDRTAFNLSGGIELLNCIRVNDFPKETFNDRTCLAIFHEIYRFGLNESRVELQLGKDSALKLFLSHAKQDEQGVSAAKALKSLIDSSPMRDFFDAYDIAPGFDFGEEILNNVKDSTLIGLHSDSYSSRYWCQREILAAKDFDRPIIAVDIIGRFEDRRYPLAANVPVIRVPVDSEHKVAEEHLLGILIAALLESIRFYYSRAVLSACQAADWFPSDAHLSERPPEACVLARLAAKIEKEEDGCLDFVYPDPPIYPEEAKHFEKFGLKPYTPLTSTNIDLKGKKLGISISEPPVADLRRIGHIPQHLTLLMQDVARYSLSYGAELVYGGDLREGGFTEFLFQEGQAVQGRLMSRNVHLTNYIAWPIHLDATVDVRKWKAKYRKVATMIEHDLPVDVRDLVASTTVYLSPSDVKSSFVWSRSLTAMRQVMIGSCDCRITAGGRITGYKGWMPGVLEEVAVAIELGKPIFLIGGFGGVTSRICDMIAKRTVSQELTYAWQLDNNPGLREMTNFAEKRGLNYEHLYGQALDRIMSADLRNGLTMEENEILFATPFVDEVVHLVLKGIGNI